MSDAFLHTHLFKLSFEMGYRTGYMLRSPSPALEQVELGPTQSVMHRPLLPSSDFALVAAYEARTKTKFDVFLILVILVIMVILVILVILILNNQKISS